MDILTKVVLLRRFKNISAAAEALGVSRMTLYRWDYARIRREINGRLGGLEGKITKIESSKN
jgi:predicted site-specific integrase-resolvase